MEACILVIWKLETKYPEDYHDKVVGVFSNLHLANMAAQKQLEQKKYGIAYCYRMPWDKAVDDKNSWEIQHWEWENNQAVLRVGK
jgi:hypothetical protein